MTMPQGKRTVRYPFVFGGISSQPEHIRLQSQVDAAENASFSVADGVTKRHGSRLITAITDLTIGGDYGLYSINRDNTEQYLVIYGDGELRIFELLDDGTTIEATVTFNDDTESYLNADTTFDTGSTTATYTLDVTPTPTISSTSTPFNGYTHTAGDPDYIYLAGGTDVTAGWYLIAGKNSNQQLELAADSRLTADASDVIVDGIRIGPTGSQNLRLASVNDYTFLVNTNVLTKGESEAGTIDATTMPIQIVRTGYTGDGSTPATFTVSTIEWAPRRKTITPSVQTGWSWFEANNQLEKTGEFIGYTWYDGDTIDVLGGTDIDPGTYNIKRKVNNNRVELFDDITPNGTGVNDVEVGDIITRDTVNFLANPLPSIIKDNRAIADITSHRNRLVLVGDENVLMSQAGDFFNLWIDDVDNLVDSDRIDYSLSSARVTLIDYVVPFRNTLIVFTKAGQQFEINAPDVLSPDTINISPSTRYETFPGVRPQTLGALIYFASPNGENSILYEYAYDDSRITNFGDEVSAHVRDLLPAVVRDLAASPNREKVAVLPESGNTIHLYSTFHSARRKEQSAWTTWSFQAAYDIRGITTIIDQLYMLVDDGTQFTLESVTL